MNSHEDAALVARGYGLAREVTRQHAKSFYFASSLLFGARRRAAFALYAFCRRLDDMVDEGEGGAAGEAALQALPARLARARQMVAEVYVALPDLASPELDSPAERLMAATAQSPWDAGEFAALKHAVHRYRIPERPFQELISGMEMDLTLHHYRTWEELHLYCFRVAGVVGLMMAPVLGCRDASALGAAEDLGVAMQLTNILRDVAEDLGRGRIYLPEEELAAFGLSHADLAPGGLAARGVDARWRAFMRFQVERARAFYARGAAGIGALGGFGCQRMVRLMGATYGDILRVIEARDYDVFSGRAFVPTRRKVQLGLAALAAPGRVLPAPAGRVALPALPPASPAPGRTRAV
jgi:phytoene synthase